MIQLDRFTADPRIKNEVSLVTEALANFIIPILLTAVSVAVFVLYVVPTYKLLPELQDKLTAKTQEVMVLQAKVDQLKSLQANRDLVVGDLVKLSWALEERDKVPELSEQVRLMSKDAGVDFSSLEYSNANKGTTSNASPVSDSLTANPDLYREEKVNVTVNAANLTALVKYLQIAESSIRLFKVESLRISTDGGVKGVYLVMSSPYLNPSFSSYSQSAAPIDLKDTVYRSFMTNLETFSNYAQSIDAALPKI